MATARARAKRRGGGEGEAEGEGEAGGYRAVQKLVIGRQRGGGEYKQLTPSPFVSSQLLGPDPFAHREEDDGL